MSNIEDKKALSIARNALCACFPSLPADWSATGVSYNIYLRFDQLLNRQKAFNFFYKTF